MTFLDHLCSIGLEPDRSSDITHGADDVLIALKGNKGKKTLYYSLNDAGTYGRYYDCKTGDGGFWPEKTDNIIRVDRAELKRENEAKRKEQERIKAGAQNKAAILAAENWALSDEAKPDHPYLIRKAVKPHGIGQDGKDLIIPMRQKVAGDVIGLQRISPIGDKFFGKDTAKKGSFHLIGDIDPSGIVYVCEGYATGATVHEATTRPVAVAFDRGNLKTVAMALKAAYPNIYVIIAGDNDHKTDGNPGKRDALQAALEVGGAALIPDQGQGTDWNDYAAELGIEAVKNKFADVVIPVTQREATTGISSLPDDDSQSTRGGDSLIIDALDKPIQSPPQPDQPNWASRLIYKSYDYKTGVGILDPKSLMNGILLVNNTEALKGVFRHNDFKGEIFVCKCPPWEDAQKFKVRRVDNIDFTRLEAHLEASDGMRLGSGKIIACVEDAADRSRFHPVREYFDNLKWDGTPRLSTWLKKYAMCLDHDDEYTAGFGTMWMVAGVRRIRRPGCKFDTMLVFEGPENYGKSYMLRTLATFGHDIEEEYFADGIRFERIHERGSVLMLQGKLIVEFAEMAGFSARDIKAVQAWITLQEDEVEVKNKQMTAVHKRQFILAGTYNPVQGNGWLANIPGMRRFVPLTVKNPIDIKGLREVREQLWAEAAHLEADGYPIIIGSDSPLHKFALDERRARSVVDVWEESIGDFIGEQKWWRTSDIMKRMGFEQKQINTLEHRRVCSTMEKLGWVYKRIRPSKWIPVWVSKDYVDVAELPKTEEIPF